MTTPAQERFQSLMEDHKKILYKVTIYLANQKW
jgi:hypothetical protein